jgi:hypothetical protein
VSAARALVVERYDWSAVAQGFEDALTSVCAAGEGRVQIGRDLGPATVESLAGSISQ